MHAFSGAILGSEHDAALPTIAQIDGDSLILSSSDGPVAAWPLDHVQIIEVGNGHFEVVAEDRRLSLVVDQPEAFEEALEAERARRSRPVDEALDAPEVHEVQRPKAAKRRRGGKSRRRRFGFISGRPRHGPARVRLLPFIVAVAAIASLGSLAGSWVGDVVREVTTDSAQAWTPSAEVALRTFLGSGNEATSPFMVQGPWEIRWSFDAPAGGLLEVIVLGDDTAENIQAVRSETGSGTVPLVESGRYRLEIRAPAEGEWTLSVIQVANADVG
jgi:hypothetical protein